MQVEQKAESISRTYDRITEPVSYFKLFAQVIRYYYFFCVSFGFADSKNFYLFFLLFDKVILEANSNGKSFTTPCLREQRKNKQTLLCVSLFI